MNKDGTEQKIGAPTPEAQPSEPQHGRGLKGAGLRYTAEDGVPEWAVGKTADEITELTDKLYKTIMNGSVYAPQPQAPAAPSAPAAPYAAPFNMQGNAGGPPDTALLYQNPEEYNRQLSAWHRAQTEQHLQNAAMPMLQGQVELAKAEAKRNPKNAEVWKRYAPEIEAELAHLPASLKANPKIWNDAADLIYGRHSDVFERDKLAAYKPADTGIMGADGLPNRTGTPQNLSPIAKAWAEDAGWIQQFKRLPGMSVAKLRQQVQKMGSSEADYVKHYEAKLAMRIHNSDTELVNYGVSN